MPVYTYRREDGTTFDLRQSFSDPALTTDPQTGQKVVRVVQAAGVIFKGSGFYINDSKSKSTSAAPAAKKDGDGKAETKVDAKSEGKSDSAPAKTESAAPAKAESSAPSAAAAAD